MAIEYDPAKHEMLVADWWFRRLANDPVERNRLFHSSLHSLTKILWWAAHDVKLAFEMDSDGIWIAAWLSPYMSGAEAGAWIRADRRRTIGAFRFIRKFYDAALEHFPVIVGITKQKELHDLHLALGYRYVGEISGLFDNAPAMLYQLTEETRREAKHGQFRKTNQQSDQQQRVHAPTDEPLQHGQADAPGFESADSGGAKNGRRELEHSGGKRKRRKRTRSLQPAHGESSKPTGEIGSFE
jgi:hypothetical protein